MASFLINFENHIFLKKKKRCSKIHRHEIVSPFFSICCELRLQLLTVTPFHVATNLVKQMEFLYAPITGFSSKCTCTQFDSLMKLNGKSKKRLTINCLHEIDTSSAIEDGFENLQSNWRRKNAINKFLWQSYSSINTCLPERLWTIASHQVNNRLDFLSSKTTAEHIRLNRIEFESDRTTGNLVSFWICIIKSFLL